MGSLSSQGENLAMITVEMKLERAPESRVSEPCPTRKPYQDPQLQEWGSILDLTGGPAGDVTDVDGGGSQPF
jgi:hypothetical protein